MNKITFKEKVKIDLKTEWDNTQREIGFWTAINKVKDILEKENHIADVAREINKLNFKK